MNLLNSTRSALRAIRVNTLRSFLTVLGIVLGVSSVIVMMAVGAGARLRIQNDIRVLGANVIALTPAALKAGGVSRGAGSKPSLTIADFEAIRALPDIVASAPQQNAAAAQLINGASNWSATVIGTTPDYLVVREWRLDRGEPFDDDDVQKGAKVILLGKTVAQKLFGNDDPIGQEIRINRVPVQVVGVLAGKGQSANGSDLDDTVVIPLTTSMNRVVGRNPVNPRSVSGGVIKVRDEANLSEVEAQLRALLRDRHGLAANQPDDFQLLNLTELLKTQDQSTRTLGFMLAAIAGISLLVGGIGVMNIMLVSITERTREIGLRLAIGARRSHIRTQFLVEAATLSLIGGLAGVAIGLAGALFVEVQFAYPVVLSARVSVTAMAFAAGVGLFFGFYPAHKASRLQPIEALRQD